MSELGGDQPFELLDELVRAFGQDVQAEQLDCNQAFALCVISPKDGAEGACTNLMKNTERSEGLGNRRAVSFRVQ